MSANENDNAADFDAAQAEAALRWWRDAGVDLAIVNTPQRWFDRPPPETRPALEPEAGRVEAEPRVGTIPAAAARSLGDGISLAGSGGTAAAARDLEALRAALESFEGCALKKTATQLVFADGVPGSRIMLVGEAPGAEEDRVGRPFVGRAGQLLDRMLASIGLDRTQVYIANTIPWRPPGNRTPTPQETQACLPFIRRQIELSNPEILVCLGASATQALLGVKEGITRVRGRWFPYPGDDGRVTRALAMLHPAYLLRRPADKRHAWTDLRALDRALRGAGQESRMARE